MAGGGEHFIDAGDSAAGDLLDALEGFFAGDCAAAEEGVDEEDFVLDVDAGHEVKRGVDADDAEADALGDDFVDQGEGDGEAFAGLEDGGDVAVQRVVVVVAVADEAELFEEDIVKMGEE